MATKITSLQDIESAIKNLSPEEQRELLSTLWKLLNLSAEDVALLKTAESAFTFWDNPEDAIYDTL